tara:strand:+ start:368 stop:1519 length:1152 start_codon:yes stop_codon:yes gene_type:complete
VQLPQLLRQIYSIIVQFGGKNVVKEKSTEKKSPTKFSGGGNSGTLEEDPSKFYRAWKNATTNFKDLGTTSVSNLFEAVSKHGKIGRESHQGRDKGKRTDGSAGEVITELEGMFTNTLDIDDIQMLERRIKYLERIEKEDNPRDIPFKAVSDYSPRTGKVREKETVYGHYLTPKYREYRQEVKGQNLPEIPSSWYSKSKGKAKPPMWQALFGKGNDELKTEGLLTVLKKTVLAIEQGINLDKDKPIKITDRKRVRGTSAGVALYNEVPRFKKFIDTVVKQANSGSGYLSRTGGLGLVTALRDISDVKMIAEDTKDSELVKVIMERGNMIPMNIKSFYVTMSRRQMLNACIHAGLDKKKFAATIESFKKAEEVEIENWEQLLKVA